MEHSHLQLQHLILLRHADRLSDLPVQRDDLRSINRTSRHVQLQLQSSELWALLASFTQAVVSVGRIDNKRIIGYRFTSNHICEPTDGPLHCRSSGSNRTADSFHISNESEMDIRVDRHWSRPGRLLRCQGAEQSRDHSRLRLCLWGILRWSSHWVR